MVAVNRSSSSLTTSADVRASCGGVRVNFGLLNGLKKEREVVATMAADSNENEELGSTSLRII